MAEQQGQQSGGTENTVAEKSGEALATVEADATWVPTTGGQRPSATGDAWVALAVTAAVTASLMGVLQELFFS